MMKMPSDNPWVAIAANPYSGFGANQRYVKRLAEALDSRGIASRPIWDPSERTAALRDSELTRSCVCVIATGGDGTVADVINDRPSAPLAVLPTGNENIFAKEFGFTRDVEALAESIAAPAAGRCRTIDLGSANGRLFSLMLGVGFDAEVVHRLAQWRVRSQTSLKRVTRMSYVRPILSALRKYPYPRITLEADGTEYSGTHALVFNLPRYAFRLPFAPDAQPDDGLLDWVLFERAGAFNLLKYFWSVCRCRHLQLSDVHHGQACSLRITASEPAPIQLDGDPAGHTPVEITIVPQTLRVMLPLRNT